MGADYLFVVQTLVDLFSEFTRSNNQEVTVRVEEISWDCGFFEDSLAQLSCQYWEHYAATACGSP